MARDWRSPVWQEKAHCRGLAALINRIYLKDNILGRLKRAFETSNPVGLQIQGFLDPGHYQGLLRLSSNANFKLNEQRDEYSFFEDSGCPVLNFFRSREFLDFASRVTGLELKKSDCSLKIFMHGSYTLAHFRQKGKVEFAFDMTPTWDIKWGGASNYITEEGDRLIIPPLPDNLILVLRKGTSAEGYIKYVNHKVLENGRVMIQGLLY